MLRFTSTGVLRSPTTLQVRVGAVFDGRLRAGAPSPSRELVDAELLDNVRHFTEAARGPRSVPCDALVLSGVPEGRLAGLGGVLERARAWSVRRITLHVGPGTPARPLDVDAVAAVVRDVHDVDALVGWSATRTAVVPLDRATLPGLRALLARVASARPDAVALTWPYPPADPPPRAHEVVAALDGAVDVLGDVAWTLKGLPPCLAGRHGAHARASRNRWYVDADHQRAGALMFFPEVVRPYKADACRGCARDADCDGVATPWVASGLVDELRPVRA